MWHMSAARSRNLLINSPVCLYALWTESWRGVEYVLGSEFLSSFSYMSDIVAGAGKHTKMLCLTLRIQYIAEENSK